MRERVDAVTSGEQLGLALAEELRSLAPFGAGNPPVSLLLAAATFGDPVGFGGERRDQHARFTVSSGGGRARAVHFGGGPRPPVEPGVPVDATFTLEVNEWRGVVEPRLLLRSAVPSRRRRSLVLGEDGGYLERAFAELDAAARSARAGLARAGGGGRRPPRRRDRRADHAAGRHRRAAARPVRRRARAPPSPAAAPGRLRARVARRRSNAARRAPPAFATSSCSTRPAGEAQRARALAGAPGSRTVMAWGSAELRFAEHIHEQEYGLRDPLAACYRTLRDRGGAAGSDLEAALRGDGPQQRSPELAGRLLRILTEIGLIELDPERAAAAVTERRRVSLEDSAAYREYERRRLDGLTSLRASTGRRRRAHRHAARGARQRRADRA